MHADLEFEYPQKLEKILVKADILEMIDQEERKLKYSAFQKEAELLKKKVLTYEEYFDIDPNRDALIPKGGNMKGGKGDMTWDTYHSIYASPDMFQNDLIEASYKFWENEEDRELRLRNIWIDLTRKNAIGGLGKRTSEEQHDIQ